MKKLLTSLVVTLLFNGVTMADCSVGTLVSDARSALANKRVAGSGGGDTWNEVHQGTGSGPSTLCEIAQGSGHTVDPSHIVGNWSASNTTGEVTYDYGGGTAYTFTLHTDPSGYVFCNVANEVVATVSINSAATCP